MIIDRFCLLSGFEELVRGFLNIRTGDCKWLLNASDGDGADEFWMSIDERSDIRRIGGFANVICDIKSEEIAGSDEAVDRLEIDVVGV